MATFAFNKPYGVLSRFTADGSRYATLAQFGLPGDVWPIGRLDADSEGLLILSSDKTLVDRLLSPQHRHYKTYLAQVEHTIDDAACQQLRDGIMLDRVKTQPARASAVAEPPQLWPRDPPIRHRLSVPTSWLELQISEGKNRQVRRMTAAVGHPTLRLIRTHIGAYALGTLAVGGSIALTAADIAHLLASAHNADRDRPS